MDETGSETCVVADLLQRARLFCRTVQNCCSYTILTILEVNCSIYSA
jgi:hypothetical protein